MFAVFWYFFSIQREVSCWHQICLTISECIPNYDCGRSTSLNSTILNELCPIDSPNTMLFDFGMYLDMLQSGNTGSIHFPTKFFYSFWWGLRNLRYAYQLYIYIYMLKINNFLQKKKVPRFRYS